jgi:hypothetical protein
MKIKLKSALEMYAAIQQLDSYQDGAARPTLYKYDGDTRLRLAVARRCLREINEDYVEARNKIIMQLSDGAGELIGTHPGMSEQERKDIVRRNAAFAERERELLNSEVTLAIEPIAIARLKLDDNPIPAAVLDLLGDLISLTGDSHGA